jgi:HK97 family phage major capsid protein
VRSAQMESREGDFASWIKVMSPYAGDNERRAASRVGALHGLEMRIDPALAIKTDVGGSHLISQSFNNSLITELKYSCNWLASGANIVNTTTDGDVRVPKLSDTDQEGAVIAEKVKDTEQPPVLSEIVMKVATLTSKLVGISWEAMNDSAVNLPQMLGAALGSRIGRALDRLISTGGDPAFQGFFKHPLHTSQKSPAATAGKVTITDLIKLLGKLDRAYAGSLGSPSTGLRWVMNSATLTGLLAETATGSGEYLLADPEAGTATRILGIPVIINNFADDAAAGKFPVYLADLSRALYIRQHMGISLRRSSDFAFDQRSDVFVAIARYGSAIADSRAIVALEGK